MNETIILCTFLSHRLDSFLLQMSPATENIYSTVSRLYNPQTSRKIVQQVAGGNDNCCLGPFEILFCTTNQLHSVRPDMRHCSVFQHIITLPLQFEIKLSSRSYRSWCSTIA